VRPTHETTEHPFSIASYYSLILIDRDTLTLSDDGIDTDIDIDIDTDTDPNDTPRTRDYARG